VKLSAVARELDLFPLTPESPNTPDPDITAAFVAGLLSEVLACAPHGALLLTGQTHLNAVAVALSAGMPAIVYPMGRTPDDTVRARAHEKGIRLYASPLSTFELAGRLYALGIRGPLR